VRQAGKVAPLPADTEADVRKRAKSRALFASASKGPKAAFDRLSTAAGDFFQWTRALALLAALGFAQLAAAEAPRQKASDVLKEEAAKPFATPINDRFAIRGSYYPASLDTDVRLDDTDGNPGTPLSAEDDLGLEDKSRQFRVEAVLRVLERHRLRVDYLNLRRRGDEFLTRDIEFGDESFAVNDRVVSTLDWKTLNFTYLYSIVRRQRFELGGGFGLHLFQGEARARVPARLIREEQSGAVAFPTAALDATLRLGKRFTVNARANYLSGHIDDSSGKVKDYHADVQYRWWRNLAVGLGYNKTRTKLDIVNNDGDDDLAGRFVLDSDGPEIFFRASF
jgi:hypothetical protein